MGHALAVLSFASLWAIGRGIESPPMVPRQQEWGESCPAGPWTLYGSLGAMASRLQIHQEPLLCPGGESCYEACMAYVVQGTEFVGHRWHC